MAQVCKRIPSPVGELTLVARNDRLIAILWDNDRPTRVKVGALADDDDHPTLVETARQLHEYFAGERTVFELDVEFHGTEFQKRVWHALLTIPFGQTRSYLDIAVQLGNPRATRAVGAANGRNPLSIVAPCHRVIGSSGDLTGFAGGKDRKAALLALESRARQPTLF